MAIIYVSGPITNVPNYRLAFKQERERLVKEGHTVIDPCDAFGGQEDLPYSTYMRFHIHSILTADALVMLPGWTNSRGARFEKALAEMLGLPVYVRTNEGLRPVPEGMNH